jgi:hypothetical protein
MMEQTHLSVKHDDDDDGFRLRRMSRVANLNIFGILCLHVCMHAWRNVWSSVMFIACLLAYCCSLNVSDKQLANQILMQISSFNPVLISESCSVRGGDLMLL